MSGATTADPSSPSRTGGGVESRIGAAARSTETPTERDARRRGWGKFWRMIAKQEARNPRTLRRYRYLERHPNG